MQIGDVVQIVLLIAICLYIASDAIVKIVKKVKGEDEVAWKAKLHFAADLIEKGIELPKDLMIKLLRNKLTDDEFAVFCKKYSKKK